MYARFLSLFLALGLVATSSVGYAADAPKKVMVLLHINADDTGGEDGRAIRVFDLEKDKDWVFPLGKIPGGPVEGQPVHAVLHPNKKEAYITVSGGTTLPLRLVVVNLAWTDAGPTAKVTDQVEVLPAKTKDISDAYCCRTKEMMGDPNTQEGHGPMITNDGKFITMSTLGHNAVRVFDTTTKKFVGGEIKAPGMMGPHGLYLNPSETMLSTTTYQLNGEMVHIFDFDKKTGKVTFKKSLKLEDGNVLGAYTHSSRWIDDRYFITNAGQDGEQGTPNKYQQSVWTVDTKEMKVYASAKKASDASGKDGVLEGVSDSWAVPSLGKVYNAEGNFRKFLDGKTVPGSISVFSYDKGDPTKLKFKTRIAPGSGLPDDFSNAHELVPTPDGKSVYVTSFSTGYFVKIDTASDSVAKVWKMKSPHGAYVQF